LLYINIQIINLILKCICNYFQIIIITVAITASTYNLIQWRGLSSFFIVWIAFEATRKMLYRKDLPCSYCGFDPTWYRRDVRVARKKVEEFLKENDFDDDYFDLYFL